MRRHLIGDEHFFHIARQIKSLRYVRDNICRIWPELFINAAVPLLVPLSAPNPSSVVRMHGYGLLPQNPLRTKALRKHHGDS